jgi:hypothetical protein
MQPASRARKKEKDTKIKYINGGIAVCNLYNWIRQWGCAGLTISSAEIVARDKRKSTPHLVGATVDYSQPLRCCWLTLIHGSRFFSHCEGGQSIKTTKAQRITRQKNA